MLFLFMNYFELDLVESDLRVYSEQLQFHCNFVESDFRSYFWSHLKINVVKFFGGDALVHCVHNALIFTHFVRSVYKFFLRDDTKISVSVISWEVVLTWRVFWNYSDVYTNHDYFGRYIICWISLEVIRERIVLKSMLLKCWFKNKAVFRLLVKHFLTRETFLSDLKWPSIKKFQASLMRLFTSFTMLSCSLTPFAR